MIIQHVNPLNSRYKMDLNAFKTKTIDKYLS
jgi:hypothetical protein